MPRRRPWSLAGRLTMWYVGTSFAFVVLATGFLYWALVANLEREDDEFLADQIHILRALLRDHPENLSALKQEAELEWSARQYARVYLRVVEEDGAVLAETPGMGDLLPPTVFPPAAGSAEPPGPAIDRRSSDGRRFRIMAASATTAADASRHRLVQGALDRSRDDDILQGYRNSLWLVLGCALLLCGMGGYWIAQRGIRPVARITGVARQIRSTNLNERIPDGGLPSELSTLAGTFNEMLDRLEDSFTRLGRFSADIAHELRTPVNNLRGEVEVALQKRRAPEEYAEVLASCLEETARLASLIDDMLFLARAEQPTTQLSRETVDLARELEVAREFYAGVAEEAHVHLGVDVAGPLFGLVDRRLLQRALSNLLGNALAHTPPGGSVVLSAGAEGSFVKIEVRDTGCGIPPQDLPHVFDRFYRVDNARSSTGGHVGLGLSLVKGIMDLHGGKATIESQPGRGTAVALLFLAHGANRPRNEGVVSDAR